MIEITQRLFDNFYLFVEDGKSYIKKLDLRTSSFNDLEDFDKEIFSNAVQLFYNRNLEVLREYPELFI